MDAEEHGQADGGDDTVAPSGREDALVPVRSAMGMGRQGGGTYGQPEVSNHFHITLVLRSGASAETNFAMETAWALSSYISGNSRNASIEEPPPPPPPIRETTFSFPCCNCKGRLPSFSTNCNHIVCKKCRQRLQKKRKPCPRCGNAIVSFTEMFG